MRELKRVGWKRLRRMYRREREIRDGVCTALLMLGQTLVVLYWMYL